MHGEQRAQGPGAAKGRRRKCRPRVVIFVLIDRPHVDVLDLPEDATVGERICHSGRTWRVTGVRTGTRVLIAEPEAN
jgi:hypothetical protein